MWISVGTASGPVTTLAALMPGTWRRASSSSGRSRRAGMTAVLSFELGRSVALRIARAQCRPHGLFCFADRPVPRSSVGSRVIADWGGPRRLHVLRRVRLLRRLRLLPGSGRLDDVVEPLAVGVTARSECDR